MKSRPIHHTCLSILLLVGACSEPVLDQDADPVDASLDSIVVVDAAPDASADAGIEDSGADISPDVSESAELSPLYGPCESVDDCEELPGVFCQPPDRGFGRGLCSIPCPDGECMNGGACVRGSLCVPSCERNSDCRDGWTCGPWYRRLGVEGSTCLTQCGSQEECGDPSITQCNEDSGYCVNVAPLSSGGAVGDPCVRGAGDTCHGSCIDTDFAGGFIGGYCSRLCDPEFGSGLRANCGEDQVCYPTGRDDREAGLCLKACTSDEQCREGYGCGAGACVPMCDDEELKCPSGFECSAPPADGTPRICEAVS